ncbi:MAG: hypothetical protein OQJ93_04865 [Ignavibacteriaceae bacterium]|jgi:hypothetical protein|nr:hypothetical protein [Chlorobium sp.]MCW8822826.1 hypothetical protein [Ignavibacteriaceae bacterium]MCW9096700.1 hypothetical protein [Ignavibacteriaceae bacterium]
MIKRNQIIALHLFIISTILLTACSSISVYSPEAYKQAVDLKIESLNLMLSATLPFSDYEEDVAFLKTELSKAYEFAKGRPNNEISTKQWEILIDENRNLLGGFLKRWENDETLAEMFVTEAQKLVSDAFDTIIGLESGKISPSELK